MNGGVASRRLKRRGGGAAGSRAATADLEDEEPVDDDIGGGGAGGKRARRAGGGEAGGAGLLRPGAGATALMAAPAPRLPKAQAAIQPGSTPEPPASAGAAAPGGRFLAYTAAGCVISRRVDSHRTCEVLFHDASRGRAKLPLLTDYYGFTMAALGEGGVLYGSPASEFDSMVRCSVCTPLPHLAVCPTQLPDHMC
jgi:hypothetical protein